jgi:hypothetical protein
MRKILFLILVTSLSACTKYGDGFISPYVQYAVNQFTVVRGRTTTSYSLITDGSSIPLNVKWLHIYDSAGNMVDTLFKKEYPVAIWTAAYNNLTDVTYGSIIAKQSIVKMPPIRVNETNGTIEANSATLYLPLGKFSMDLSISNSAGAEVLKKIVTIVIADGKPMETAPEQGAFSNSLAVAGNAAAAKTIFNGQNNPFDLVTVTRFADTPNTIILKVMDRNGVPFNPRTGELTKRPNTGLNPNPPYLQNLQDYAPDTYQVSDSAISIKFPLVPFPIASLGNGFNMYYNILSRSVHIDSTATWSSNASGGYYQGPGDSHYLGAYKDDRYNYYVRIPMRVQVPGAYEIAIKMLNTTHR